MPVEGAVSGTAWNGLERWRTLAHAVAVCGVGLESVSRAAPGLASVSCTRAPIDEAPVAFVAAPVVAASVSTAASVSGRAYFQHQLGERQRALPGDDVAVRTQRPPGQRGALDGHAPADHHPRVGDGAHFTRWAMRGAAPSGLIAAGAHALPRSRRGSRARDACLV